MARQPRVVVPCVPHHVTQRGNNREDVFRADSDRRFYLRTLAARCRRHDVRLLGYCLMSNHVHLVAVPGRPDALTQCLAGTHRRYSHYFNKRYSRSGCDPSGLLDLQSWPEIDTPGDWGDVVGSGESGWETACNLLRAATRSGTRF